MKHLKQLLWGGVCLLCLIGLLLLWQGDRAAVNTLTPQLAARRWETPEKPCAMASVFLTPEEGVAPAQIGELHLNVNNALTAAGVGDSPWYYAASYETDGTLSAGGSSCAVTLTAVDGDFFRIHALPVLSGWYPDPGDVMRDLIVLDRGAAWDLFYSDNVTGQTVELGGVPYQVAAVVDLETGRYNALAAGTTRRAWVFSDSPALDGEARFTCLELVLPQPVKDFAAATLRSALGLPGDAAITDNSGRFALARRWDILRHISTRGITEGAIAYPYWENAARLVENRLALGLIPEGILLAIPLGSLLVLLWLLNRRRTWGLHSLKDLAEDLIDKKRQRDYYGKKEQP